jgi:hypothetical protein
MRNLIRLSIAAAAIFLLAVFLFTLGPTPTTLARELLPSMAANQVEDYQPIVLQSSAYDTSPPLSDLVALARPNPNVGDYEVPIGPEPELFGDGSFDPAFLQTEFFGGFQVPSPIHNFEGIYNVVDWPSVGIPPDTNGDVGYDAVSSQKFYVQYVNTTIQAWNVTDPNNIFTVLGPAPGNVLFTGFGGPCEETNSGDPIVLFDQLAERWFASQFAIPVTAPPYYQCVAISATADPAGSWYRYEFEWPNGFNDYPKFGVWPDGYYMSANQFNGASGAGVAAMERSQMLVGAPAQFIYFDVSVVSNAFTSLLPADLDGGPPPPGTPNYFAGWYNSNVVPPDDTMQIWEFHVDWATPANSTFGIANAPNQGVPTANVDPTMGNIPQPGGRDVDSLAPRLMFRLPYRYMNGTEILVANHTVDADSTNHAGVHWMELRKNGGLWSMHQDGVFAPDDDHRWMGGIAMDQAGNIAVGYSVSSETTYPSIRYAGRLASDPLGNLTQNERELVTGNGFQEHPARRWGDYSSMNIDPTDDCTFWYTQEYYAVVGARPWQTRIGSFVFPGCLGDTGTLDGTVIDAVTMSPIDGATVFASAPLVLAEEANTDVLGEYGIILGTGTYSVTAGAYGYAPDLVTGVTMLSGTVTTQDFALNPVDFYQVSGTVSDAAGGWPLDAHITIEGDPFNPPAPYDDFVTGPVTGTYSITLPAGITYTFAVQPLSPGYPGEVRTVGPLTADQVEDFSLTPDLEVCRAPGYSDVLSYFEDFEASDGGYVVGLGEWEWGTPTFPIGITPYSGDNVWGTDLNSTADDEVPGGAHVMTATLSVPAGGGVLQWWDFFGSDDGGDQQQVLVDGSLVWDSGFNEAFQDWTKQAVDISAWAGQTVDVTFALVVNGVNPGPLGWYIDDVSVAELGTCAPIQMAGIDTSGDMSAIGVYGEDITYLITITNTGDIIDTFAVSVGASLWNTNASTSSIGPLAPNESGTVEVTVTVGNGPADSVEITFTSGFDNNVTAVVTLDSSTNLTFLPVVLSKP